MRPFPGCIANLGCTVENSGLPRKFSGFGVKVRAKTGRPGHVFKSLEWHSVILFYYVTYLKANSYNLVRGNYGGFRALQKVEVN